MTAIVRDFGGVGVAVTCWKTLTLPNSDIAEAMTMKKGVEFAKDMLFLYLISKSYSQNVISFVPDVQLLLSYMGTIVDDYRLLVCYFQYLQFAHIRREANQAFSKIHYPILKSPN